MMHLKRIVSLWDMLELRTDIIAALSHIGALWEFIGKIEQELPATGKLYVLSLENRTDLLNLATGFKGEATKLGFATCASASSRLEAFLLNKNYPWDGLQKGQVRQLHQMLGLTMGSFTEEAQGRKYLALTLAEQALLDPKDSIFGREVEDAFPDARDDLEEAAKCRAFERHTATVFHLMRALEIGVRKLAAKLGATVQDQHGVFLAWGVMADNVKRKIDAMPKGDEQTAWYRVQVLLETLNKAWRNPTMHPKHSYTGEQASEVFDASKAFLRHLAPLV